MVPLSDRQALERDRGPGPEADDGLPLDRPQGPPPAAPRHGSTKRWRRTVLGLMAIAALAAGAAWWAMRDRAESQTPYLTQPVVTGDIEETVSALGSLQPLQYVDVGTQVSGQLQKIYVDYGDAVKQVGKETFRLERKFIDEMVLVDTDEMCAAIKDVFEETRVVLEPAGALAIAGAKAWVEKHGARGKTLVAVACGANTNFDRLRFIAEQAELGEHREAILAVTIPERPGSFKKFCATLGAKNITEFNYRIAESREAHIFVGIETANQAETAKIVRNLERHSLRTLDLSDNEMAKTHLRHMVGGRAPWSGNRRAARAANELLYRFEFPERPGALMRFLNNMRSDWNISLFHYRNQGADYGRVLVGIQVPPHEMREFGQFLAKLGYPFVEETRNPAYRLFLS